MSDEDSTREFHALEDMFVVDGPGEHKPKYPSEEPPKWFTTLVAIVVSAFAIGIVILLWGLLMKGILWAWGN